MCVLSIKVPIRKKSGNLSYVPRMFVHGWECIVVSKVLIEISKIQSGCDLYLTPMTRMTCIQEIPVSFGTPTTCLLLF